MNANALPPPDAAFTLTEMAVSLALSAFVLLALGEATRWVSRTYVDVKADVSFAQDGRRAMGVLNRMERADPGALGIIYRIGTRETVSLPAQNDQSITLQTRDVRYELGMGLNVLFANDRVIILDRDGTPHVDFATSLQRTAPFDCRFDFVAGSCR
ncbi:hypothetical protein [Maricaulis sp.]|uniref:hypothetical protein n=1 Tax=Maricaulis sp. TaxID=1486257 RepID=UPI002635CFF9|nr:hypothetical protein [Maricaulis sp.]